MTPAARRSLTALINRDGPLSVDDYMDLCLHDEAFGYYAGRPALGAEGDFITAPLVSQMFGELLGLWAVQLWLDMGRPRRIRLAELGPGAGVMIVDVLRAGRAAPGFLEACELWLVETSPPLRRLQAEALHGLASPTWVPRLEDLPRGAPVILLANEFLDCLPIRQAVRTASGWRERRVGMKADGALAFVVGEPVSPPPGGGGAPAGAVAEWSPPLEAAGETAGALVAGCGGAGLFIDYGRDAPGPGDTLQAVRAHRREDPLAHPGEADLTAHVDFPAFLAAARRAGARTTPTRTQGQFLQALGIGARAAALAKARPDQADVVGRQLARLIAEDQMGSLFKAAALHSPGLRPPGFAAARGGSSTTAMP